MSSPLTGVAADWVGKVTGNDHEGQFYNLVTRTYCTTTRATPKTIFDPLTGRIHDVRAGYLAVNPWAAYKSGGRGVAPVIEGVRTNSYVRSYFDADANADGLSDGWTFATGATGTRAASSIYGTQQTVAYTAPGGTTAATVKLIYQDSLTGVAGNAGTTSSYRTSASSGVTAVQRFIEAHDAAHAVLGTYAVTIADTATMVRGTGTYAALPATTAHVCSGIWATGVDTGDTVTLAMVAAMNEDGAFATSYIPTTTTAVTRNADVVTVPTAGWNAAAGTIVAVANAVELAPSYYHQNLVDASSGTDLLSLIRRYGLADALVGPDGQVYGGVVSGPGVLAMTWATNSLYLYKDGSSSSQDTTVTPGAISAVAHIGSDASGNWSGGVPIHRVTIFPTALDGAAVAALNGLVDGYYEYADVIWISIESER